MSQPGTYCGGQSDLHGLDGSLAVPVKAQIGRALIQSPKCGEDRSLCELCRQSTRFPGCGAAYRYRRDGKQQCDGSGLRSREDEKARCVAQEDSQQPCDGLAFEGGGLFGAWGSVSMSTFGSSLDGELWRWRKRSTQSLAMSLAARIFAQLLKKRFGSLQGVPKFAFFLCKHHSLQHQMIVLRLRADCMLRCMDVISMDPAKSR
jgi:hypothetical protein